MAAPTVAAPPSNAGLKKLGFVPEAGARGCEIASNIYSTAKGYVPASLQPRLDNLEVSVSNVSGSGGSGVGEGFSAGHVSRWSVEPRSNAIYAFIVAG